MPEYAPIDSDQRMPSSDQSYVEILPSTVYTKLSKLYPSKASGPNEISCWSLKIYTDILAHLILKKEHSRTVSFHWHKANVVPIPKCKHVKR